MESLLPLRHPYRVFISSTFLDLKKHREVTADTISRLQQYADAMERFGARPDNAIATSVAALRYADIYIGLFAWRYGVIKEGETRSVTHLEYDEAVKRGIPRLIFLADPATEQMDGPRDLFPGVLRDHDHDTQRRAFRDLLEHEQVVDTFTTPDDLGRKVACALFLQMLHEIPEQLRSSNLASSNTPDKKISLMVSATPDEGSTNKSFFYKVTNGPEKIVIMAQSPYFDQLSQGGPVEEQKEHNLEDGDEDRYPKLAWEYPTLDIKLVNNTDETLFFTKAILHVARSIPDFTPIITFYSPKYNSKPGQLILTNEGWSDVSNLCLSFNIFEYSYGQENVRNIIGRELRHMLTSSHLYEGHLRHTIHVGTLAHTAKIDLSKFFLEQGYLRRESAKIWNDELSSDREHALIYGVINYVTHRNEERSIRFFAPICLRPGATFASPVLPPLEIYQAELQVESSGPYTVHVSIAQYVKSREVDWFRINLQIGQTSWHQLQVELIYNQGNSVKSMPIDLYTFIGRSPKYCNRVLESVFKRNPQKYEESFR